jgi:uncharacterized protein YfaS (alpha-2-macroglobulin family)
MSPANDHIVHQVDDFLHELLTPDQAAHFEQHCTGCADCQRALEQGRQRLAILQSLPPTEASTHLVQSTLDRIDQHEQQRRRQRRLILKGSLGLVASLAIVLLGFHFYYATLTSTTHDLLVLGQRQLLAGTSASLRVRLVDRQGQTPLAGVPVTVELHGKDGERVELARFNTDAQGGGSPRFRLPDWADGDYELRIRAQSSGVSEVVSRPVQLTRFWKLMLSSDKPVYQPGQTIRLRALALRRPDLLPARSQPITFTVADPKNNIIYKQSASTSKFGISATDCALASEILEGNYTIACQVGNTESRLSVEVKKYVLPKFKVEVDFDRPFYAPEQKIRCTIQANYPVGKPVAGAEVEVFVWHGPSKPEKIEPLRARTDDKGSATVEVAIPEDLPGLRGESGEDRLAFEVKVTDTAGQKYTRLAQRTITDRPVRIEAIPESGALVEGVPNRIYVLVTGADGKPVRDARLSITGVPEQPRTDERGATSFTITPSGAEVSWVIRATDARGQVLARRRDALVCGTFALDFLVRTDRAVYTGGDTMNLTVLGAGAEPVFIDFIKDGQTLLTETVPLTSGRGTHSLDLPADLFGTVQVVAYRFDAKGVAVRKSRVVYIRQAGALKIRATLDKPEYRPGRRALLNLRLTDGKGTPVAGAFSLAGVDEAVFALLPQRLGLEQLFYTLEQDLLRPMTAIYPWTPDGRGGRVFEQALFALTAREDIRAEGGVRATRAGMPLRVHTLAGTSFPDKAQQTQLAQKRGLHGVWLAWYFLLGLTAAGAYVGMWWSMRVADVLKIHVVAAVFLIPLVAIVSSQTPRKVRESARRLTESEERIAALMDATGSMDVDLTKTDLGLEKGVPLSYSVDRIEEASVPGAIDLRPAEGRRPRVRQLFPETMLWKPQLITDDQGRASLPIDLADSITTWRLSASAVSADGRLGAVQLPLKVFQPFFADFDLPVSLTRGDEVGVPVVVYNWLDKPQTVTLQLERAKWFDLIGDVEQKLTLAPGEVRSTLYRVRVKEVGEHALQVTALGAGVDDALKKMMEVVADGRRVDTAWSGTLDDPATVTLNAPEGVIPGSAKAFVKIYPSSFSQLVEGLENIFRMPYGCFEQTSSTTYPNVLALDYLQRTGKRSPKIEARARHYIHLGYQRLLTFEVPGGGFDWFGRAPANTTLTAYGLMEFEDMARVHDVDPALIGRTRKWLLAQRKTDGSWNPDGQAGSLSYGTDPAQVRLATTAYIAWAVFAGGQASPQAQITLDYLLSHPPARIKDPHVLALVCNALAVLDPKGQESGAYLSRLASLAKPADGGKQRFWEQPAGARTTFFGAGLGGQVETTALATLALLHSGRYPGTSRAALAWLVAKKDASGTWYSTQATVLALKALLTARGKPLGEDATRRIEVRLGEKFHKEIVIPADQAEVMKQIDLSPYLAGGAQQLTLTEKSATAAGYQVTFRYHVPEEKVAAREEPLSIKLSFDRPDLTKLTVGDDLRVTARVVNNMKQPGAMVMLDLPVPAGFSVRGEDFTALVTAKRIERFQLMPRQVLVYLRDLPVGKPLELTYGLRATLPVKVQTPGARVYEYYDPQKEGRSAPLRVEVKGLK